MLLAGQLYNHLKDKRKCKLFYMLTRKLVMFAAGLRVYYKLSE